MTFNDNPEKTIDFRRYLKGPVFEPLKDVKYFKRFFSMAGQSPGRTVRTLRPRNCTRAWTSALSVERPSQAIEADANTQRG